MYGPSITKRPAPALVSIPPVGSYLYPWSGQLGTGTLAVNANRLYAALFATGVPISIDRVGYEVTTGSAGFARMGAYTYDPSTGLPSTLISDCGVGITDNIAVVEITPTTFVVPAGLFFLAIVFSVTPTVRRMSAVVPVNSVPWGHSGNSETGSNSTNQHAVYGAHTYGALPTAFPAATYASASHLPKLHLRRA